MTSARTAIAVFFYGLFMDESVLASKGVRPTRSAVGHIEGYALRIGQRATLVADEGATAHGVLMVLAANDVDALYADPSVVDYVPEPVAVTFPDGTTEPALCYNLPLTKIEGANPEYARALAKLATSLGLPPLYVERIRAQAR